MQSHLLTQKLRTIEQMQQIIRGEFHIDNIKKSNIIEIYPAESGEFWYKAKIAIVTIDEKAGKEKKSEQLLFGCCG